MADDAGQESAVPRYRDPEKAARIVEARRRGEKLKDIAAREGLSMQRVWEFCRDAGLTGRGSGGMARRAPDGKCPYELRRDGAATWPEIVGALGWRPDLPRSERARRAADAARGYAKAHGLPWPLPNRADPVGKRPYELRRDGAATWIEIADALGWRPDLRPERRALAALKAARRYAKANGLTWPLPDRAASERRDRAASERRARRDERDRAASERAERAASERMAGRDERGLAQVREMVEEERQVLALFDKLPKDRTITEPEAERFLVELCRIGLKLSHIAKRTNCSHGYVKDVVRRRAPELMESIRPGAPRGKKRPQAPPLLDIQELRIIWRREEFQRQIDRQDAPMFAAWLSGE